VIHGQGYGIAVDWWSLGTLLYEMLTGLPPFYNQNLHVMYEKIIRGKLTFPAYLSASARSLLAGLLDRSPKSRLGSHSGLNELRRHPFFEGLDWDKLYRKELKPPFKPDVTEGKMDTSYVDEEFKKETPKDTPDVASTLRSRVKFENFTFAGPESNLERSGSSGGLDADGDSPGSDFDSPITRATAPAPATAAGAGAGTGAAPTAGAGAVVVVAAAGGEAGPAPPGGPSLLGAQLAQIRKTPAA